MGQGLIEKVVATDRLPRRADLRPVWRCIALARSTKRLVIAGGALVVVVAAISLHDGGPDISDPHQLVERLEAAGIEGCRVEDQGTAACFDAAGVAYFRAELIDEEVTVDDAVSRACDESTILALFTTGQSWFGRVRAHPERAPDLATALGSTAIACASDA